MPVIPALGKQRQADQGQLQLHSEFSTVLSHLGPGPVINKTKQQSPTKPKRCCLEGNEPRVREGRKLSKNIEVGGVDTRRFHLAEEMEGGLLSEAR